MEIKNLELDESSLQSVGTGAEDYPLLRTPSKKKDDDEHTLRPGQKITARFLGTKVMVSKEPQENWEKEVVPVTGGKPQTVYTNKHFVFEDGEGKKFGLFRAGSLWKLEKLFTTALGMAKENPIVQIEYVGLIATSDTETLEKYGIEVETGDSVHVFDVKTSKDAKFDLYAKGCVNLVAAPVPVYKEDNGLSGINQDMENYRVAKDRMAAIDSGSADAQLAIN